MTYRSRPTKPNPFGDIEEPTVGDLADVIERARRDRDIGLAPVVEYRVKGAGWSPYRPVVTCDDLRAIHLARENTVSKFDTGKGKMIYTKGWQIDPAGQRAISDAAVADPLDFDLAKYAVKH